MPGFEGRANRSVHHDVYAGPAFYERMDMAIAVPAKVLQFHPDRQTATVQLQTKAMFDGEEVDLPNLLEVPVDQPRGAGFAVTFPIGEGDTGVVHFMHSDQDAWQTEGEVSVPLTARRNSLSDGRFTPGASPDPKAMSNYDAGNFFMGTDDHKNGYRVSPDGTLAMEGNGESLLAILSELLQILSQEDTNVMTGSSAGLHPLVHQPQYAALLARLNKMKLR